MSDRRICFAYNKETTLEPKKYFQDSLNSPFAFDGNTNKKLGETEKTISPSTVNRQLGTLRGMFNKAVGVLQDEINVIDIKDATSKEFKHLDEFYRLVKLLN